MAKKKTTKNDITSSKEYKELKKKVDELTSLLKESNATNEDTSKELAATKELVDTQLSLLEEKEELLSDAEDKIKELESKEKSDRGLPDGPNPEIESLKNQVRSYKDANKALTEQLEAYEVTPNSSSPEETLSLTESEEPLDMQLVATCIGRITDSDGNPYNEASFLHYADTLVKQAVILARTIQSL